MLTVLEILLPLRNPTEVIRETIDSLVRQTDRGFSVVVSDNYSSTGFPLIEEALATLRASGIAVRLLRPPFELGRVEHWNWLHFQAAARWLKPLFSGDWLEPDYVKEVRAVWEEHSHCRFIHCGYFYHPPSGPVVPTAAQCLGRFLEPEIMHERVLHYTHQFGPPIAVAYERDAFLALGGYKTSLPICADSLLCCQFAVQFGVFGIPRLLGHFNHHGARFSTDLAERTKSIYQEKVIYIALLVYHAWTENRRIPTWGVLRLIMRELRQYFQERSACGKLA